MLDQDPQNSLFGFRKGDAPDSLLSTEAFRSEWRSEQRFFMLSDKSSDLADGTVLAEGPRTVLRVNHPMPDVAPAPSAPAMVLLDEERT